MIRFLFIITLLSVSAFSADIYGMLPTPTDMHMTENDLNLYYGILGIVCSALALSNFKP